MNSDDLQSFLGFLVAALLLSAALLFAFAAVPIAIAGLIGGTAWYFYKKGEPARERAKLLELHKQVEELEERSEIEFRNAIHEQLGQDIYLDEAIGAIVEWEGFSAPPEFPKTDDRISIARYKDAAANYIDNLHSNELVEAIIEACRPLVLPPSGGPLEATRPLSLEEAESLDSWFDHPRYFKKLRQQLLYNKEQKPKEPFDYIRHTPFELIKERPVRVGLTDRFEHVHILGGTGAGKTQLIQYLISDDLEDDCTIIVIDNQRQMIPKLARLGHDMQYISPQYPLALNLFDMPRGHTTAPLLRYVLSGLMNAPLTAKQAIVFQFAVDLMLAVKGNINTFHNLLQSEPGDFDLSNLDATARKFFNEEFYAKGREGFESTRREISWRVWTLLTNPVLRDMFAADENRCQLELDRKLILIDTDIDTLQDYSGLFGRFFIAQLLQLAHHRFQGEHRPVYVYIDECYYYLDDTVVSMLETARKAKIGLILAHQFLGQLIDPQIARAVTSLTSNKFAGQLSPEDAAYMARAMRTTSDYINEVEPLHFALARKGHETLSIKVPTGVVESMEQHPIPDEEMKERYGRPEPIITPPPPKQPPEPPPQYVEEEGDF